MQMTKPNDNKELYKTMESPSLKTILGQGTRKDKKENIATKAGTRQIRAWHTGERFI